MRAPSIRQRFAAAWSVVGPGLRRSFVPFLAKVAFIIVGTMGAFAGHKVGTNLACQLVEPLAASISRPDPLLRIGSVSLAGHIPGDAAMAVCIGIFTMTGLAVVMMMLGVLLGMILYRQSLRNGA